MRMGNAPRGVLTLAAVFALGAGGCNVRRTDEAGQPAVAGGEAAGRGHIGDVMDRVGRRFERLGRAALAHRWEFAGYQAHEIEESIETLPSLEAPEGYSSEDVGRFTQEFLRSGLPPLEAAIEKRDSS